MFQPNQQMQGVELPPVRKSVEAEGFSELRDAEADDRLIIDHRDRSRPKTLGDQLVARHGIMSNILLGEGNLVARQIFHRLMARGALVLRVNYDFHRHRLRILCVAWLTPGRRGRRYFLHARRGVAVELEMQRAHDHPVHPP